MSRKNKVNRDEVDELFALGVVCDKEKGVVLPAILHKKTHNASAKLAGTFMFLILDRYLSCVPDEHQIAFEQEVFRVFGALKNGPDVVENYDVR